MIEDLIGQIIVGAPNFVGLIVAVYIQYKLINRLMDKVDDCNCPRSGDDDNAT